MRLGVMIGAERGDMSRKVKKLVSDIEWADSAGLATAWMPQVPDDFDLLTMVSLMASHSTRIELGTAVVPLQAQHPIALARQAPADGGSQWPCVDQALVMTSSAFTKRSSSASEV